MLQLKTQYKQPQIHYPFCASWHKFGCYTKLSQANKSSFGLSTCEILVALLKSVLFPSPPGKEQRSAALSSLPCRTYTIYYARAREEHITRPAFRLPHAHLLPSLALNAHFNARKKGIYADKRQRGKAAFVTFLPPLTHL